ncbi:MAG: hypothetical protein Q8R37_03975, partial [Nanoarchaeota archaeon]|nr:hypothetical protein [Nanoarchaeota archaeon]
MKKKVPESRMTIDDYFTSDGAVSVGFISEVYFNSRFFNEHDYRNLLQHFKDSGVKYIVMDGVASRIDRPEFLKEEVTYWGKDYEQCVIATKEIPNREQYQVLMNAAEHDFDHGLSLTKKVLPDVKIVVNIFDDDMAFSSSELEKEILVSAGGAKDDIIQLKGGVDFWKEEVRGFEEDLKQVKDLEGGWRKRGRAKDLINRKIARREHNIAMQKESIEEKEDAAAIFTRPKKARPIHQYTRGQIKDQILTNFQEICQKYKDTTL